MHLKTNLFAFAALLTSFTAVLHADYISAVNQDNPLVYYRFEETSGTSLANAGTLGASHDGTTFGAVNLGVTGPITAEASNSALGLNGTDAYATANAAIANAGFTADGSYSVELWFRENQNHLGDLVALTSGASNNHGVLIEAQSANGGLRYLHRSPAGTSGGSNINPTAQSYSIGDWHHLVAVNDSGAMRIYIDGVLDANTATAGTAINFDLNTTIGRLGSANNLRYYNGDIDEFALYGQALTASRIQAHFNAAAIPEPSSLALLGFGLVASLRAPRMLSRLRRA